MNKYLTKIAKAHKSDDVSHLRASGRAALQGGLTGLFSVPGGAVLGGTVGTLTLGSKPRRLQDIADRIYRASLGGAAVGTGAALGVGYHGYKGSLKNQRNE